MSYDAGVDWEPLIYLAIDFHFLLTLWPAVDASLQASLEVWFDKMIPLRRAKYREPQARPSDLPASECPSSAWVYWAGLSFSGQLMKTKMQTSYPLLPLQSRHWDRPSKARSSGEQCLRKGESGRIGRKNTNLWHQLIKAWPTWLEVMEEILPTNTVL